MMRPIHQQQTTCGLQVCQHPLCWDTNRQAIRGLLQEQQRGKGDGEPLGNNMYDDRLSPIETGELHSNSEDDLFGLPTLKILNMIDDYGASPSEAKLSESLKIDRSLRGMMGKSSQAVGGSLPAVPKLALKSYASMSVDDVTAPANTPLHSYHDFEGTGSSTTSTSRRRTKVQKSKVSDSKKIESTPPKYGKVLLQIGDNNAKRRPPKKMLVWCPSLKSKREQVLESIRRKQSSMKHVDLPLHSVPEYNLTFASHKAIKGMVCKKNRTANNSKVRGTKEMSQTSQASRITPQEVELLRRVPLDVLIRVLNQAEENKLITKEQSRILLARIGKKDQLPPIGEKSAAEILSKVTKQQMENENKEEKATAKPNPVKILDLEYSQSNGERIVSAGPGVRVDATATVKASQLMPSRTAPPSTRALAEDSQYDKKLRSIADENLKNIRSLIDERSRRKRTPVKYIATLFDEDVSTVKPFHYKQSTRDLFLGPIPSPPPPSPPTERDSLYDPQLGGSTVLVNPSVNEPSTITSIGDRKLSARQLKTPLSITEDEDDARHAKMTQTSGSQIHDIPVVSPYDSSVGDGWPQVNEGEFLEPVVSSDYMSSPITSFMENDIRTLSRNESAEESNTGEEINEKFSNAQRDETESPVPPPPSPEPTPGSKRSESETANETRRITGAATALGLVGLPKNTSTENSPDTGTTPTPVVSSVRSTRPSLSRGATASYTPDHMPIVETPYENELDDEPEDENNFEENVSRDVARAELEEEVKKLDVS